MTNAVLKLRALIGSVVKGAVSIESFCREFEQMYNFDLGVTTIDNREALAKLFEVVGRYAPPAERLDFPGIYADERKVLEAAEIALHVIRTPP